MQTLFLAYANAQEQPLPTLSREDDTVYRILVNRYLKGHYLIHRDSFTNLAKINDNLGQFSKNIALFAYSGHADGHGFHFDDQNANARGIARQLGESARAGILKLLLLNGCSTAGQVNYFLEQGVPAVVATSCPVGDQSATEFAIRFFQCLVEKRLSIREAFEAALNAAQTATAVDLEAGNLHRGMKLATEEEESAPVWGLYSKDPNALLSNPIPSGNTIVKRTDFVPNDALTDRLFDTLLQAGNRKIKALREAEEEGEYIETGSKQTTIVNVLPFPIAIHLQKLLCPVELDNEGFDKVSMRRLEQMGRVFHTSVEFLAFILLAQLWEYLKDGRLQGVRPESLDSIRAYFYADENTKLGFHYLQLIRCLYLDLETVDQVHYFVGELAELQAYIQPDHPFAIACDYLNNLQNQLLKKQVAAADIGDFCEEAEEQLCHFFAQLGFLHRYELTSIQNIDIQKYRHQDKAQFNHELVKLMRAFGKPEHHYYLLPDFLDNRGVVLVKGKMKIVDPKKRQFVGQSLDFLNLSPFIIDRNAFEEHTDLSNLLFFELVEPQAAHFRYKNVKRPESIRDRLIVADTGDYVAIAQQIAAFRNLLLNESLSTPEP